MTLVVRKRVALMYALMSLPCFLIVAMMASGTSFEPIPFTFAVTGWFLLLSGVWTRFRRVKAGN
jgi:hypothetical protein